MNYFRFLFASCLVFTASIGPSFAGDPGPYRLVFMDISQKPYQDGQKPNGAKQELIKVELPPMGKLLIPSNTLEGLIGQTLWVLSGKLNFQVNTDNYSLEKGDCIALNTAADCNLTNPDAEHPSVYVVAFAQK